MYEVDNSDGFWFGLMFGILIAVALVALLIGMLFPPSSITLESGESITISCEGNNTIQQVETDGYSSKSLYCTHAQG